MELMPIVPHGPLEGAEYHHVKFTREPDDPVTIDGRTIPTERVSMGGSGDLGYYFIFRGDPEKVLKMVEILHEAAKQMLPAGRYKDNR